MIFNRQVIIEFVLKHFSIEYNDLTKRCKTSSIVEARKICMFLLNKFTNMSYPEIATMMKRTHPTVMSNIKRVKTKMKENEEYKEGILEMVDDLSDYEHEHPVIFRSKDYNKLIGRRREDRNE